MPKIIENAVLKIIDSAKEELTLKGYDDFSIREVSKKSNVAIGTIYNYFPSKQALINKIVYNDWNQYQEEIQSDADDSNDLYTGLNLIFSDLVDFVLKYESMIKKKFNIHEVEVDNNSITIDLQIIISNFLRKNNIILTEFEESFITEAFLFYSVKRDFSYNKLDAVIRKLIEAK